jgi:dTDP-4-amino-4,6-dideoxygalactose transaminase
VAGRATYRQPPGRLVHRWPSRYHDKGEFMGTEGATPATPFFALADPTLAPRMLSPWRRRPLPFPFNQPRLRYYYLGRYATHALLGALGLAGTEMLLPAFIDTPIVHAPEDAGVSLRFYNVRPDFSAHIDDIRAALTPKTKVIYLVHFNGFPGPIDAVMELAKERDLLVIEDAAHALQTTIDGRPAGSIGDGSIFSLYKWLPVPNGGAALVNRPDAPDLPPPSHHSRTSGVALTAFSLLDHLAATWGASGWRLRDAARSAGRRLSRTTGLTYVETGGSGYHREELDLAMSAVSHVVLRAQDFDRIGATRRRNYTLLGELLADIAPPLQGPLPDGVTPLFYATRVEDKRAVVRQLHARGVQAVNLWEGLVPGTTEGEFPDVDELRRTTLELPIHQDLSVERIRRIATAVRDLLASSRPGASPPSDEASRPDVASRRTAA